MADSIYTVLLNEGDAIKSGEGYVPQSKAEALIQPASPDIVSSERPAYLLGLGLIILALAFHKHRENQKDAEAAEQATVGASAWGPS